MFKSLVLAAPFAAGGLYLVGAFDATYSREVGKPQAQVMQALADLDISEQPGAPGTNSSRSGGIQPMIKLERDASSMSWVVMSGNQVATRMTATFEPLQGGATTRVRAKIERGDAPDDLISPAFRSTGVTMGLFAIALDSELDEMIFPNGGWGDHCDRILEDFAAANFASADLQNRDGTLSDGFGDTASAIIRIGAADAKLKAAGCNPDVQSRGEAFAPISSQMSSDAAAVSDRSISGGDTPNVRFEPGKPMVSVKR